MFGDGVLRHQALRCGSVSVVVDLQMSTKLFGAQQSTSGSDCYSGDTTLAVRSLLTHPLVRELLSDQLQLLLYTREGSKTLKHEGKKIPEDSVL